MSLQYSDSSVSCDRNHPINSWSDENLCGGVIPPRERDRSKPKSQPVGLYGCIVLFESQTPVVELSMTVLGIYT